MIVININISVSAINIFPGTISLLVIFTIYYSLTDLSSQVKEVAGAEDDVVGFNLSGRSKVIPVSQSCH